MRRSCVMAAFVALVALAPSGALRAEPASAPSFVYDAKSFTWHPGTTLDKFDSERFLKTSPGMKPLDQIDFGGSQLRLDTSRYPADFVPRALDDAPDLGDVIVPHRRGKKSAQRWRQYIGLTFTTPTN
ncbi:MAG: hypothetical protein HY244_04775 [Rhizobiales bacterium]|nr:hypothetical protein [Hyphomicrobiales bacterium]